MRIVIDLQSCQSGSRHGGIGRYSMNLVQAMARNAGSHDLHIMLSDLMPDGISEIYRSLDTLIPKRNMHYFRGLGPVAEQIPENRFRARAAELIRENYIFSLQPDIVHLTSLFEGLGDDVTTSVGRFCDGATTAVTLYDLIPLVESDKYLTNEISKNHYLRKIDDLRNAGILLSISEYSRLEAIQELDISPEKITNISSAVDKKFKPWKVPQDIASSIKNRYGITRDFLMYTGSFDQRKNHEALIKAFAALPIEVRKGLQLLIVGNGWEGIYAHLKWIGSGVGLSEDDILFAGKVPDDDLLPLYNLCSLFVFPSLREGFGLPVLEAMSCGIPVIGSNSTSIPEVLGTEKALFNPADIGSISQKIYEAVTDSGFRTYLIEHGIQQAKNFSWDVSAKRAITAFETFYDSRKKGYVHKFLAHPSGNLIKAINALPEKGGAHDIDLINISNSIEQTEIVGRDPMNYNGLNSEKIGLISTWGTKCGIAMYSKYLTERELENYTILAANDSNTIASDQQNVIRCWHLGNDNLSYLLQVVLDEKIGTILIQFNYGFFDFAKLGEFVHKLVMHGREVSITLHSTTDPIGYENKELKSLKNALSLCSNIFVHSANDIVNLNKIGLSANVKFFPQGVFEPGNESLNLRISNDTFIIASYGFYLPHKGFHELIDAIFLLKQQGIDVHLLMLNAMYDAPISRELVGSAKLKIIQKGLENQVSIVSDFLSEDMTIRMMRNANLIVFPYQETGESSSAAVRMGLASGVPVAVTPLSIFDDVNDVVFKLPGTNPDKLALGIKLIREEIKNCSVAAKKIGLNASQWKRDRGYSILGRRLKNILRGGFKYFGADLRLGTQVGKRIGQDIVSTGQAGYLVFGPYVSLDAGQYRVAIHGRSGTNSLADVNMDVVVNKGQLVLGESVLTDSDARGNLVELCISLDVPCTDLEVRVWVDEKSDLQISMIEITPWQGELADLQQSVQAMSIAAAAIEHAREEVEIEAEELLEELAESPVLVQPECVPKSSVVPSQPQSASAERNSAKAKRKKRR